MESRILEDAIHTLRNGGRLPALLEAVWEVGSNISLEGDRKYQLLEELAVDLPLPARQAAERHLLDAQRTSRRWEVLSADQETEEIRISKNLTTVANQLESPDIATRLATVEDLTKNRVFPAAPALATRLQVEDTPVVQAAMARALGFLGGRSTIPLLKRFSRVDAREVRLGALEGLGYQCCSDSLRLTLDRLIDDDAQVRSRARELAGTHAPKRVVAFVRRIPVGRADHIIREVLAVVHVWVGTPCVDAFLERLSSSGTSDDLRTMARRLLGVRPQRFFPSRQARAE